MKVRVLVIKYYVLRKKELKNDGGFCKKLEKKGS